MFIASSMSFLISIFTMVSDLHRILLNWNGTSSLGYNVRGIFFLYSGVSAITILFVVKHVPETKGKTPEEIQASINTDAEKIAECNSLE
ncbi:hypothetical protein IFM89_038422 [Coptis chinensis]|uniref:Uncharacterized protein n=1 Tax=Coptis chinensis TaxID=261450 RepID=A0A835HBJ8_9MAGN|nr:hypothetical protein IFM89_038422 [Coptis chinensis]